jgi:hypothetical protein
VPAPAAGGPHTEGAVRGGYGKGIETFDAVPDIPGVDRPGPDLGFIQGDRGGKAEPGKAHIFHGTAHSPGIPRFGHTGKNNDKIGQLHGKLYSQKAFFFRFFEKKVGLSANLHYNFYMFWFYAIAMIVKKADNNYDGFSL